MSFRSSSIAPRAAALCGLLAATASLAAAADTASPNEPIPKPECDANVTVSIRYSETTGRLYLESADNETRGGCVTLGQIFEAREGKAPLYAVDPDSGDVSDTATGTWLLSEELYVEDGITLKVSLTVVGVFCWWHRWSAVAPHEPTTKGSPEYPSMKLKSAQVFLVHMDVRRLRPGHRAPGVLVCACGDMQGAFLFENVIEQPLA